MIKLKDMTPEVYYNQSRDFQFIGRLFDLVLNSVKTNADLINNLPLNDFTDEQLVDLLSMTLGFKSKHRYNSVQLKAICGVLPSILKRKGSAWAIYTAITALIHAENIPAEAVMPELKEDTYELQIYLPAELTDTNLFNDLLDYIIPAGLSCRIIKETRVDVGRATDVLTTDDEVEIYKDVDSDLNSRVIQPNASGQIDVPLILGDTPGTFVDGTIYTGYSSSQEESQGD